MIATFILVDYNNAPPARISELAKSQHKVLVFLGHNQDTVSLELATALQVLGKNGEYVQAPGDGPQALDLHIAYYMGKIACDNPHACIHVVSNNPRFDPLIQHLRKTHQAAVSRSDSLDAVISAQTLVPLPLEQFLATVENWLSSPSYHGPRTLPKLHNGLKSFLPKSVTKAERQLIITALRERGHYVIEGNKLLWPKAATFPVKRPITPSRQERHEEPQAPKTGQSWDDDDIPF
ncbi:PIN domain-containing protein [Verrucomicrobium sp. BvORR106]|uniref:PIN domain-containing protein n=1 Tax=Verrucomicrobium sp. BvORR106 TaxID=1403819 RepID=UPI00068B9DB3|nr:PIN domain-containing protein [Verrucomicrobium sp. BvORR106]